MAPFEFSAHPTAEQLRTSVHMFLRGQYRLYRIMGVLMVVLSVVPIALGDYYFGLFGVLLGLAFIVAVAPLTTRTVLRKISPELLRPTRYVVDEPGVRIDNDRIEQFFRWSAVDRIEQAPGMLIGRIGKSGFLALPLESLPPATAAELTTFVLARVPAQG
jgi:hypothetical protein